MNALWWTQQSADAAVLGNRIGDQFPGTENSDSVTLTLVRSASADVHCVCHWVIGTPSL